MAAYIIVDIDIHDPDGYEDYKKLTPATLERYGGRFAVRGGHRETLEGQWPDHRLVILEFDTIEAAKKWWNSPEYAPAKALRQKTAHTNMIVVEGFGE